MNQQFDLVCQLGSQVMYIDGEYKLAPHTHMRTEALAIVLQKGIAPRAMVLGGSNFSVRYDDKMTYGPAHPTQKKPNFSFEAFAESDYRRKPESTVIKEKLVGWLGEPFSKKILTEPLSATTEENAAFLAIMLKRRPMFTGNEKIGILTLLYHMEKALPIFQKAGLNVKPLFAENLLVLDADAKARQTLQDILLGDDPIIGCSIDEICEYYATPKGGKQYDVDRIRQLLTEGRSLEEMMWPYWYARVNDGHICADGEPEQLEKISTKTTKARDREGAAANLGLDAKFIHGPFATMEELHNSFA